MWTRLFRPEGAHPCALVSQGGGDLHLVGGLVPGVTVFHAALERLDVIDSRRTSCCRFSKLSKGEPHPHTRSSCSVMDDDSHLVGVGSPADSGGGPAMAETEPKRQDLRDPSEKEQEVLNTLADLRKKAKTMADEVQEEIVQGWKIRCKFLPAKEGKPAQHSLTITPASGWKDFEWERNGPGNGFEAVPNQKTIQSEAALKRAMGLKPPASTEALAAAPASAPAPMPAPAPAPDDSPSAPAQTVPKKRQRFIPDESEDEREDDGPAPAPAPAPAHAPAPALASPSPVIPSASGQSSSWQSSSGSPAKQGKLSKRPAAARRRPAPHRHTLFLHSRPATRTSRTERQRRGASREKEQALSRQAIRAGRSRAGARTRSCAGARTRLCARCPHRRHRRHLHIRSHYTFRCCSVQFLRCVHSSERTEKHALSGPACPATASKEAGGRRELPRHVLA